MGAFSELDLELKTGGLEAATEPFELGHPPATGGAATVGGNAQSAWADLAAPTEPVSEYTVQSEPEECDAPPCEDDEGSQEAPAQSEEEKRKAHEEAEAKRKAEFDAKQAAKKQEEARQLAKVTAMTDDEVMMASMKKVSEGTEKLTRRNMKDCVSEYIQTKCLEDPDFARLAMHPRKNMVRCFQHINRKAWEYVQDELKASGIQPGPGQQGYGSDVPDDLCYQWAEEYFRDPDAKEDHEDDEKFVPKPYYGSSSKKSTPKAKKEKKAPEKKQAPKPKNDELDGQQMSLLGAAS